MIHVRAKFEVEQNFGQEEKRDKLSIEWGCDALFVCIRNPHQTHTDA
jgi:hypothetical protein